jgi:diadenosine tetraphosphatase ApaH/serine/threonine PP2A family protein phosphatase
MNLSDFSSHARRALEWTRSHLSPASRDALEKLPSNAVFENLLVSHGSPVDPVWGYILSLDDAVAAFSSYADRICFFGHTHIPSAFIAPETFPTQKRGLFAGSTSKSSIDIRYGQSGESISLNKGRFLLNPGSVGFPRDAEDAHSSDTESKACARYAIYDSGNQTWEFRRVEYDLWDTSRRMKDEGLW